MQEAPTLRGFESPAGYAVDGAMEDRAGRADDVAHDMDSGPYLRAYEAERERFYGGEVGS